jgi:hypothetical protein
VLFHLSIECIGRLFCASVTLGQQFRFGELGLCFAASALPPVRSSELEVVL